MGVMIGAEMALNGCAECLKKQRAIDRLTEELQRLKQKLRDQERQGREGFFGSSTPSAKLPVKANTPPAKAPKRQGAQPGHAGAGRQTCAAHEAARSIAVAAEVSDRCPSCDLPLEDKGTDGRLVLDRHPVKAERVL
jgi:transposase